MDSLTFDEARANEKNLTVNVVVQTDDSNSDCKLAGYKFRITDNFFNSEPMLKYDTEKRCNIPPSTINCVQDRQFLYYTFIGLRPGTLYRVIAKSFCTHSGRQEVDSEQSEISVYTSKFFLIFL